MSKYKIVRLISSNQVIFATRSFGSVDLRRRISDTPSERKAVESSLKSLELKADDDQILRLVTIINVPEFGEALRIANEFFEETIDLLSRYPMAKFETLHEAGYWINLETGRLEPFLKQQAPIPLNFGNVFVTRRGIYEQIDKAQYIAAGRNDELLKAYLRSINWFNKSKEMKKKYLKFLFLWISVETLSKVKDDDNIIPRLLIALGFPSGKDILKLDKGIIQNLNLIPNYTHWKKHFLQILDEGRKLRNDIVHSGFKEQDIPMNELDEKIFILENVHGSLSGYIESIILSGVQSLEICWNVFPEYVNRNQYYVGNVSGNFLLQFYEKKFHTNI